MTLTSEHFWYNLEPWEQIVSNMIVSNMIVYFFFTVINHQILFIKVE